MKELKFNVKNVTLLCGNGTDKVTITIDAPSTFPAMGYEAFFTVEVAQGYGESWCKEAGIEIDKVIVI